MDETRLVFFVNLVEMNSSTDYLLFKACDLNVVAPRTKYQRKFVCLDHFKLQGISCCQFHAKTHCCRKERVKLCDTKGISSAWFTAFACQTKIPWDCGGIKGFGKSFPFLELLLGLVHKKTTNICIIQLSANLVKWVFANAAGFLFREMKSKGGEKVVVLAGNRG